MTVDDVEQVALELAATLYPDDAHAGPAFRYIGGSHGRGLLESALMAPQQTVGGRYLARTIFDKAAILFRSIVKNHSMVDGNKRLALATVAVFLWRNEYLLAAPTDEAVGFTLRVASTEGNPDLRPIARWLRRHSIGFDKLLAASSTERRKLARAVGVSVQVLSWEIRQIK